ncbi:MAG: hypothetical protein VYE68_04605 [Acidobacteriota bacterium]|nr:hypothetical protein [Acidobacteriota bacterium]
MNQLRMRTSLTRLVVVGALMGLSPISWAQTAREPATPDGWEPRRTASGHPDLQGYWDGGPANASHSIEEGCCDPIHARMQSRGPERLGLPEQLIVDPPDGWIPYQDWAAERRTELLYDMETPTELGHIDPEDRCLLLGAPRSTYRGDVEIRQNEQYVVIQYEWAHAYRVIPIEPRAHISHEISLYNGDSRGHWEGDTLVVDVTNLNDQPWLDSHGSFYSDALHVVERYTLIDDDMIRYEATLEDPNVFTQPWTLAFTMGRKGGEGYEFFEEACSEGVTNVHRLAAGRQAVAAGERYIHTHDAEK